MVYTVTWNTNGQSAPLDLDCKSLLGMSDNVDLASSNAPDIYCLGWASNFWHLSKLCWFDLFLLGSKSSASDLIIFSVTLCCMLRTLGQELAGWLLFSFCHRWCLILLNFRRVLNKFSYIKIRSLRLIGFSISVFVKKEHLLFVRDIESQYTRLSVAVSVSGSMNDEWCLLQFELFSGPERCSEYSIQDLRSVHVFCEFSPVCSWSLAASENSRVQQHSRESYLQTGGHTKNPVPRVSLTF